MICETTLPQLGYKIILFILLFLSFKGYFGGNAGKIGN